MADITQEGTQTGCIRVLHFVSTLSRGSGVMSVIMNYYRHIDRDKVQFDFLHFIACEDSYMEEIRELGGKIYCIDKPGSSFQSIKQLNSFFRLHAGEYTWLHNHEVYLTFLLRPIAKRYGLEKFIVHCHATKYSDKTLNAARNRILCLPIRFMKVERFACSEAAGIFLYGKRRMNKGEIFILHNAIDSEKFQFDPIKRERIKLELKSQDKLVIGHVGRFERQKNHEFLIKVFAEYQKQRNDSVLVLIGDGSLRKKVEMQVRNLGLEESVLFLGQRDDVADLYQGMDLFILPSRYEGVGVVLLEAQLAGLPCIASDCIPEEASAGQPLFVSLGDSIKTWTDTLVKKTAVTELSGQIEVRLARSVAVQQYLKNSEYSIKESGVVLQNKYQEGF